MFLLNLNLPLTQFNYLFWMNLLKWWSICLIHTILHHTKTTIYGKIFLLKCLRTQYNNIPVYHTSFPSSWSLLFLIYNPLQFIFTCNTILKFLIFVKPFIFGGIFQNFYIKLHYLQVTTVFQRLLLGYMNLLQEYSQSGWCGNKIMWINFKYSKQCSKLS